MDVLGRAGEDRVDPGVGGTDRRGFEVGDRDQRGWAPGFARTKRNARRNRRSVVSAADLHPRHCFRSGAPSSKSYCSQAAVGAIRGYPRVSREATAILRALSTAHPRDLLERAALATDKDRDARRRRRRTAATHRPASACPTGVRSRARHRDASRPSGSMTTARPRPSTPRRPCDDRRPRPSGEPATSRTSSGLEPPALDVPDARVAPVDVVAVERAIALGMERPEAVGPCQLEVAEPTVGIRLEQERMDDRVPERQHLAPAAARDDPRTPSR